MLLRIDYISVCVIHFVLSGAILIVYFTVYIGE